ncbi:MAG: extracellular solute-binding protein [Chloroflexota bacterium]|nr:extracellular solute-binding protein [Chloroflexota bacterium]
MCANRTSARLLTVLAALLLVPMGLIASDARAQEVTTLTLWLDTTGGSATADCIMANAVDPFNASHDSIQVEATLQANSWDATRTALAGGAGPDLVGTPGPTFVMPLARAGQVLALDDFAAEYEWAARLLPWAVELGRVDGTLYSIPSEIETLVLYYNETLFEENGWEAPDTIDEMMALAEEIAAAGLIPFSHANAEWPPSNEWFVGEMINHVAGPDKVYDALTGAIEWTDADFVTAVNLLTEMQQNGWFMGGLDRYYTATGDERLAAFGNGEAAMNIEGTWFLASVNEYFGEAAGNENEWAWVPVPSTTGDDIYTLGIGQTYSINANTRYPEAAAEYLDFYFSAETQGTLVATCGLPPAPLELSQEALDQLDPRHAALLQALNETTAAGSYGYTTWTFWPPAAGSYLIEEIERVWAGEMTAEEYWAGHQEAFDEGREDGSVLPIPDR